MTSKTATMFKLEKSNLAKISIGDTKLTKKGDTIENSLKKICIDRINMINKRCSQIKEMVENTASVFRKKQTLLDIKAYEEVKNKVDRQYERVYLARMSELKIIKISKAIKEINKNPDEPVTNFYQQLIQDNVGT